MVKLFNSILMLSLLVVSQAGATLFITLEEDLRGTQREGESLKGEIHGIGGSLRKVISDEKGDRWTLYLQGELGHNLSEAMLHQAYALYKGPLGRWNISLGRVRLPWGLLTEWSSERMPYSSPYNNSALNTSDNGLAITGVVRQYEYGVAFTQGYGMSEPEEFFGPGVLTARFGVSPGLSGAINMGLSASFGTNYISDKGHGMGHLHKEERTAFALDATLLAGRGVYRVEGGGRVVDDDLYPTLFSTVEYALLPRVTLMGAGQAFRSRHREKEGFIYAGVEVPVRSLTIRGGYQYEESKQSIHSGTIQLYRSFSTTR